jgi:hypothetical protein
MRIDGQELQQGDSFMPSNKIDTPRSTRSTGINFESGIIEFLDVLRRESPLFRRRSRSEVVNMIIEEYAANNGKPLQYANHQEGAQ